MQTPLFFCTRKIFPGLLDHNNEIGIDTETTGLNLSRDRLCLIQIGVSPNECHLVKFEKSEVTDESKYKNLKSLLKNNNIKKIFHYARFDLAIIKKFFQIDCQNIFLHQNSFKIG